jgi:lipopolysaccharide export system permease protein
MSQLRFNVDSLNKLVNDGRQGIAQDMLANVKRQLIKPVVSVPPKPAAQAVKLKKAVLKSQQIKELAQKAMEDARNQQGLFIDNAKAYKQQIDKPLNAYTSFDQTFVEGARPAIMREAKVRAAFYKNVYSTQSTLIKNRQLESVKTAYELYTKYGYALICLVFIFIGAPMGAIIRKGGFGYPVLVSIIFFVTFIMLTILCRKFAELLILSPFWAAMLPCIILAPVGFVLTRKAQNDSQMINTDRIQNIIRWVIARINRKKESTTA